MGLGVLLTWHAAAVEHKSSSQLQLDLKAPFLPQHREPPQPPPTAGKLLFCFQAPLLRQDLGRVSNFNTVKWIWLSSLSEIKFLPCGKRSLPFEQKIKNSYTTSHWNPKYTASFRESPGWPLQPAQRSCMKRHRVRNISAARFPWRCLQQLRGSCYINCFVIIYIIHIPIWEW